MRVLFITSQVITRHATMKRAAGMAGPLLELGWKVEVLTQDHLANREYFGAISGLKASFFPNLGMRDERKFKNHFLRQGQWDLVHVCGLGWRNAISRTSERALVIMDHVELESSLSATPFVRRLAQSCLERWSRRYYQGSIGASRWLENWLISGGASRVQHLPYGADYSATGELELAAEHFVLSKGLSRYALYCGGMYRNYGFWTMLEGFVAMANSHDDFSAVLLGSGPEKEEGQKRIEASGLKGRIRFPGYVPERELQLYLAGAAVHVSPLNDTITDRARCPSKIPMYMMTGRPVITCRVGEAWEYLGDLGHYYIPGDSSSFAAVLEGVWRSGSRFIAYKHDRISWKSLAARYSDYWTSQIRESKD